MSNCLSFPIAKLTSVAVKASAAQRCRNANTPSGLTLGIKESKLSHAEMDNAEELDEGDPTESGDNNLNLLQMLPHANVFGGCCGTDERHVKSILMSYDDLFQQRMSK